MPPSSCTRRTSRRSWFSKVSSGMPSCCRTALAASGEYWPPIWKAGSLLDRLAQLLRAHPVAQGLRALVEQRVLDQTLERLLLQLVAQLRGQLGAPEALLPRALLAQPRVTRLFERDLAVARLGGVVRAPDVEVHDAVGTPGGEDQRQSSRAGGTGTTGTEGCAGCRRSAEAYFAGWVKENGGADGTRTRDPRRDRPVF